MFVVISFVYSPIGVQCAPKAKGWATVLRWRYVGITEVTASGRAFESPNPTDYMTAPFSYSQ